MVKQSIILVTSPQGGSGKSTIAINLAVHFAKQDKRVLLIDLAGYGSIPPMLKIPIRGKGMSSLITAMEQSDHHQEALRNYFKDAIITYPQDKHLHLLISASPVKMEKLTLNNTMTLLQTAMSEAYDLIVIDTSSELCERNIACIEQADYISIPVLQDVSSGWKVLLFKEILDNLNIARENVGLVVNRCNKYSAFSNQEYEAEIGYSIVSEIEDLSRWIQRYMNAGIPAENSGKRRLSSPFQKLANHILKQVEEK